MKELILASSSTHRRTLLQRLGLPFQAISPNIDESPIAGETPLALVQRLARRKAAAVASAHAGCIVVGSDQVAVIDGPAGQRILGKPANRHNAIAQLIALSGREAQFLTSLCVRDADGAEQLDVDETRVHFRTLNAHETVAYVDREQPFDCAGAFRSEGLGVALFKRVESEDPNALIGLPLIRLCDMLRKVGLNPLGPLNKA